MSNSILSVKSLKKRFGGLEAVNNFVSNFIYPSIQELSENPGQKDYKTRLQEHYAKQGKKVNYEDQSS